MSKCEYCDFELVEPGSAFGPGEHDYLEGRKLLHEDGYFSARLAMCRKAAMRVSADAQWEQRFDYSFGDVAGYINLPSWFDNATVIGINYCPMCGRELNGGDAN